MAWMPNQIRYAAPTSLMTVKASTDRSTTTPKPTATSVTCPAIPSAFPNTVRSAARRPCATARETTNITLGPGTMISAKDSAAKARRELNAGTNEL